MKKSFYFPLKRIKLYILSKIRTCRYKDCASHLKFSTNCDVNVSYIKWFYMCVCVCARARTRRAVGCTENGWLWRLHLTDWQMVLVLLIVKQHNLVMNLPNLSVQPKSALCQWRLKIVGWKEISMVYKTHYKTNKYVLVLWMLFYRIVVTNMFRPLMWPSSGRWE
jgi:hypothetical protein